MGSNNDSKNPWAMWRKSQAAQRQREEFRKKLKVLELEVERIRLDMFESLVRDYSTDAGFLRAISRYTGNSQHAWEIACGPDGRMRDMIRTLGWDQLKELIRRVRRIKYGWD